MYCVNRRLIILSISLPLIAVQEERAPPVSKLNPIRVQSPTPLEFTGNVGFNSTPPPPLPLPTNMRSFEPPSPVVPNLMSQSRMFGSLPNLKMNFDQERSQHNMSMMMPLTPSNDSYCSGSRPTTPSGPHPMMYPEAGIGSTFNAPPTHVSPAVLLNADAQTEHLPESVRQTEGMKLEDVFEGARQSLLNVIEWGKRIPAFTNLSLDDQVKLLKSSWCEHVLLKLATRIGPKSNTLLLSSGLTASKDNIEDPEVRRIVERVSHEISYWFDIMHVDRVELACLKGIILFNPGKCLFCCCKFLYYLVSFSHRCSWS